MSESKKRVLVTGKSTAVCIVQSILTPKLSGASGVLGAAVYNAFNAEEDIDVIGMAYSNNRPGLQRLDLSNEEEVNNFFNQNSFDCVFRPSFNCNLVLLKITMMKGLFTARQREDPMHSK